MAHGHVKWWDDRKGYDFIAVDNSEDVFVHYSALQMEGFKTLFDGQPVEFEIHEGPKGVQAINVRPTESADSIQPKRRQLNVFLCHSSSDKPAVWELYSRLALVPYVLPWLDEKNLLPGQD